MNLFLEIKKGNRVALAKAITILESKLKKDQKKAEDLIHKCLPLSGKSIRIGITGSPGVGKSTFIDAFGKMLIERGKKVAVLAIDPSSEETQGSILGDKIRMNELAKSDNAFIRPSPSAGDLGGVSSKTRENIILCEASGFDIILVETVGIGQSETLAKNLVDFYLLLVLAGAGDEIQGIKRGVMELIDALVVTKSDGKNIEKAKQIEIQYKNTIPLIVNNKYDWIPYVGRCSSFDNSGLLEIWETIIRHNKEMLKNNYFTNNRSQQNKYWLHRIIREEFGKKKYQELLCNKQLESLEEDLQNKKTNIYRLIREL